MSDEEPHVPLTRDAIRTGTIREMIRERDPELHVLSDEELHASRHGMFGGTAPTEDVWLFGYGSLIWNPTIHFAEKRSGTVYGLHRRFCLKTKLGRGSPDCPGLMLGLDHGGCCRGVAFRIPGEIADQELEIIWRREMVADAYKATWLKVHTDQGEVPAIGFVMNRYHPRYIGRASDHEAAEIIAEAKGFLGRCSDYLFNTVEHLDELGIPDRGLTRLCQEVEAMGCKPPSK